MDAPSLQLDTPQRKNAKRSAWMCDLFTHLDEPMAAGACAWEIQERHGSSREA